MKTCKKHGLTEFRYGKCYACHKEYNKKYYQKNKEKVIANNKRLRSLDPEHYREYSKKWDLENKEKRSKIMSDYYQRNKLLIYQRVRNYERSHPDFVVSKEEKRRARELGCEINDFTVGQWREMLRETKGYCHYCRRNDVPMTQDHVIPLSRGGNHTKDNIVPACRSCNSKKYNKLNYQVA